MKGLAVAGTVAMFLVGGSIISPRHPHAPRTAKSLAQPSSGWVVPNWAFDGVVGLVSGVLCTMVVHLGQSLFGTHRTARPSSGLEPARLACASVRFGTDRVECGLVSPLEQG